MRFPKLRRPRAETADRRRRGRSSASISVASALTPEMADRTRARRRGASAGRPARRAARGARVRARARLALALARARGAGAPGSSRSGSSSSSPAAHLAKGLDVEEADRGAPARSPRSSATASRFDVPGDRSAPRTRSRIAAALAGVGVVLVLSALELVADCRTASTTSSTSPPASSPTRALYFWLRPLGERVRQSVDERREVRYLVEPLRPTTASPSSRCAATRAGSSPPAGRSFLAYRVVGGVALISGDPVGDEAELGAARRGVRAPVPRRAAGGSPCSASRDELLPLYARLGLRSVKLGDEAVIRPRDVLARGPRDPQGAPVGHPARARGLPRRASCPPARVDARLRAELERVSDEWRGRAPERGFTMAMDSLFAEPDDAASRSPSTRTARVGGFLHLVPLARDGGLSLVVDAPLPRDAERADGVPRRARRSNGRARRACAELSLNFCVFADLLHGGPGARCSCRTARFALLRLDRLFQIERLHAFNRKFFPEWRPRYVCFERLARRPRRRARVPPRRVAPDAAGALDAPARARPVLVVERQRPGARRPAGSGRLSWNDRRDSSCGGSVTPSGD